MWGYTEEQIASFGLTFGVGAFMLYMLFIIGQLAWESKAGKFGTFVLFLGLSFGMVGFVRRRFVKSNEKPRHKWHSSFLLIEKWRVGTDLG